MGRYKSIWRLRECVGILATFIWLTVALAAQDPPAEVAGDSDLLGGLYRVEEQTVRCDKLKVHSNNPAVEELVRKNLPVVLQHFGITSDIRFAFIEGSSAAFAIRSSACANLGFLGKSVILIGENLTIDLDPKGIAKFMEDVVRQDEAVFQARIYREIELLALTELRSKKYASAGLLGATLNTDKVSTERIKRSVDLKGMMRSGAVIASPKTFGRNPELEREILVMGVLAHEVAHFYQDKNKVRIVGQLYELNADYLAGWFVVRNAEKFAAAYPEDQVGWACVIAISPFFLNGSKTNQASDYASRYVRAQAFLDGMRSGDENVDNVQLGALRLLLILLNR